ncbi:MAG: ABC transporter permease [Chloroflexi bacterium]|nr:ABC transporter permease [Chloroflexota bacterium]
MSRETSALAIPLAQGLRQRPGVLRRAFRVARQKPLGALSLVVILGLVVVAVLAPTLAPYDPYTLQEGQRLKPPGGAFPMGTDYIGRDVLSRIIWGSRISLYVGFLAVCLGTTVGAIMGLVSGFFEGKTDLIIQRVVDSLMAFPGLIFVMAMVSALGASTTNAMIAITFLIAPANSRIVRGAVMSIKQNQYIEAARAIGCGQPRILFRHILPNVFAPIIILASVGLGNAILTEASLSFLGLGTPPPTPSWGADLSGPGRQFMETGPWTAIFPGLAISVAVFAFNLFGDAVRDVLDPRLRGS